MSRNTGRCDSTTYCEACNGDDRYPHVGKPIVNKPQDKEGVRTPSHYMLFNDIEAIEVISHIKEVF